MGQQFGECRETHDVSNRRFNRFVNDSNPLVKVGRIASSFESDDSISERVYDILQRLDISVTESNSGDVESRERSNSIDEVTIFLSDMRNSDRANREEYLYGKID